MKTIQVGIRFPIDVKDWLAAQAAINRSSQNSEVIRAVRAMMKAAGAVSANSSPAAQLTEETPNRKATSHVGDDSSIRV